MNFVDDVEALVTDFFGLVPTPGAIFDDRDLDLQTPNFRWTRPQLCWDSQYRVIVIDIVIFPAYIKFLFNV